ncbi:MAG TPA: TlpA disulfide reductase family protein [Planctomycetota bacterium]
MLTRTLLAVLLSFAPVCTPAAAQEAKTREALVAELREIANRETLTEAAAVQRAADADAWLQASSRADLGELQVLRTLAATFATDTGGRSAAGAKLLEWFGANERLPAPGFEQAAGRVVLFEFVKLANAAKWDECQTLLPTLLRACPDHQSAYWLLGRRARDAATEAGTAFLQRTIIPALLADHGLDDAERVNLMRRLYAVEYTGPKPFVDVSGPALAGGVVRTADSRGRVLLVDYWATWCTPCLLSMPGVVAAYRRFHEKGFDVVSISIDEADRRERLQAKVNELALPFPVVFDGGGAKSELALANKVLAVPATFLIDRKGRVRWTGLEGDELARRIEQLLAEK